MIYLFFLSTKALTLSSLTHGLPCSSAGKESACNAGDPGLLPWLGRSSGEGKGYPVQYPGLENPMDRGAWWAAAHRVTKSQTRLSHWAQPYTSSLETPTFEAGGNCWILPREVQALLQLDTPASPLADEEIFPVSADGVERALGGRVFWTSRWSTSFLNLLLILRTSHCTYLTNSPSVLGSADWFLILCVWGQHVLLSGNLASSPFSSASELYIVIAVFSRKYLHKLWSPVSVVCDGHPGGQRQVQLAEWVGGGLWMVSVNAVYSKPVSLGEEWILDML